MSGYMIENTPIAVDYWHVSTKPHLRFFFLTHCHADHTNGLDKSWHRPIYCSPVTAKLAAHLLKIDPKFLIAINVDETRTIDYDDYEKGERRSFHATALDANHCPGAVMFLLDGWFGRILCTGDFRYEKSTDLIDIARIRFHTIDRLYLDGTNWANGVDRLPTREEAKGEVLREIAQRPGNEFILLTMPQSKLGKERLLIDISLRFGQPICVEADRLRTLEVLGYNAYFTANPRDTRFHVVKGSPLSVSKIFTNYQNAGRSVFVVAVTSLPQWKLCAQWRSLRGFSLNAHNTAVVPYSDHSSREELETFLGLLRVRKIQLKGCKNVTLTDEERSQFENEEEIVEFAPYIKMNDDGAGDRIRDVPENGKERSIETVQIDDSLENLDQSQENQEQDQNQDQSQRQNPVQNENQDHREEENHSDKMDVDGSGTDSVSDGEVDSAIENSVIDQSESQILITTQELELFAALRASADEPVSLLSETNVIGPLITTYENNFVFTDKELDALLGL